MKSCVSVFVERSDEDKNADENGDADQMSNGRLAKSGQSIGLFAMPLGTKKDIDFRVSGLSHAVMKQAENFRVRELAKKVESHPHRRALHADLQHNNTHNPFSEELKVMIRDMDSVRAMRNNSKSAMLRIPFLLESRNCLLHCAFSQSRTSSSKKTILLCSTRQIRSIERAFWSPQRAEEMFRNEIYWNSRLSPMKSSFS